MFIAIDFDHTLVEGDKALPKAKDAINLLREHGHHITIHSCNDPAWIEKVLNNNDIRFDRIWAGIGKPIADCYIDDRGFKFSGDWSVDVHHILAILEEQRKLDNG